MVSTLDYSEVPNPTRPFFFVLVVDKFIGYGNVGAFSKYRRISMSYQYASRNYYNDERKIFALAYSIHMTDQEAWKILYKLNTHCAKLMKKKNLVYLKKAYLSFRGNRGSGNCSRNGKIRISHNPSMGLLLHEFAHHAHYYQVFFHLYEGIPNRGTSHHGLHFDICLSRLHDYAKNKGYWQKKKKNVAVERLMADPVFNEMVKNGGKEKVEEAKEVLDIAAGV